MTDKAQEHPAPAELKDEQLDDANGGIIAILIGLAKDPKPPAGGNVLLGDGSVRTG